MKKFIKLGPDINFLYPFFCLFTCIIPLLIASIFYRGGKSVDPDQMAPPEGN